VRATIWADLAALPEEIRRKMRLIHFPDEAVGMPTVIPMLSEGEVLTP
jgi:hypothetical protein